jgi:hypothetical protein
MINKKKKFASKPFNEKKIEFKANSLGVKISYIRVNEKE